MTLKKRKVLKFERGRRRSYYLEKLALEKAKDLSQDRLCDDGDGICCVSRFGRFAPVPVG